MYFVCISKNKSSIAPQASGEAYDITESHQTNSSNALLWGLQWSENTLFCSKFIVLPFSVYTELYLYLGYRCVSAKKSNVYSHHPGFEMYRYATFPVNVPRSNHNVELDYRKPYYCCLTWKKIEAWKERHHAGLQTVETFQTPNNYALKKNSDVT